MSSLAASIAAAAAASTSQLTPVLSPVSLTVLLRSNDPSLWKLKLYKAPSDHFDDMIAFQQAVQLNVSVTAVELTWRFLRHLPENDRVALMEAIGAMQNVKEIAVEVVGPTSILTAALGKASNLASLRIGKMRLDSNQDVVNLATVIRNCRCLQQFSLSATANGNSGQEDEKISLDPMLNALAELPILQHIRLQHYLNSSKVQPASEYSLRLLCHSPRTSLILNTCDLSDAQCMAIADELKTKSKTLASTLSILVVTRNPKITALGWDAFVDLLAVNTNIVDFHTGEVGQPNDPTEHQRTKINYYLKLNVAGRGKLLQESSSRETWMDFVVRGRDDLDLLLFALQMNPSLCSNCQRAQ